MAAQEASVCRYHVAFIADDSYAIGLAVALKSLLTSLSAAGPAACSSTIPSSAMQGLEARMSGSQGVGLHVWLVDAGLSLKTQALLQQLVDEYNNLVPGGMQPAGDVSSTSLQCAPTPPGMSTATQDAQQLQHQQQQRTQEQPVQQASFHSSGAAIVLHFLPASARVAIEEQCSDSVACSSSSATTTTYHLPPCSSYATQCCWLKLLLPQLLWQQQSEPDYLLYLDCDMLILENPCRILEHAASTFKKNPSALLAAVRDIGMPCGHSGLLLQRPAFNLDCRTLSSCYFNAGLLLYNLAAWRLQLTQIQGMMQCFGFKIEHGAASASCSTAQAGVDHGRSDACQSGVVQGASAMTAAIAVAASAQAPQMTNSTHGKIVNLVPGALDPSDLQDRTSTMGSSRSSNTCGIEANQAVNSTDASTGQAVSATEPGSGAAAGLQYHDQDALNIMSCAGSGWLELEHKWNVQGIGTYLQDRTKHSGPQCPALFTPEKAHNLESHPGIVHFTGPPTITPSQLLNPYVKPPSKPWACVCLNPFCTAWYKVLDTTPWAGWRPAQQDFERGAVQELMVLCKQLQQAPTAAPHTRAQPAAPPATAGVQLLSATVGDAQASSSTSPRAASPTRTSSEVEDLEGLEPAEQLSGGGSCMQQAIVCSAGGFDAKGFLRRFAALCLHEA